MTDYQPIDCQLHDEFEIAIMRGQKIRVELLVDASWVKTEITPLDTRAVEGEEFLVFQTDVNGSQQQIRLDRVRFERP